jgi:hypothetical protein
MASAMSCNAAIIVMSAVSVCNSGSGSVIVSWVGGDDVCFEMCCIFVTGQFWLFRFSEGKTTTYVSYLMWEFVWLRFSKGVKKHNAKICM